MKHRWRCGAANGAETSAARDLPAYTRQAEGLDVATDAADLRLNGRFRDPAADFRVSLLVAPRALLPVSVVRVGRLHALEGPQARGPARLRARSVERAHRRGYRRRRWLHAGG